MKERLSTLVEYRDLAPEVRHFVFEIEDADRLPFVPGQFVSVTERLHGRDVTRAYSIASPPDGRRFELCLNRVLNGLISPHLFTLKPGDKVRITEPNGYFLPRQPMDTSLFVATGTGIAPVRAILKHVLANGEQARMTLLFGVRHADGILYRDEFEQLAAMHPNFRFWPTLSRPEPGWQGRTGHVQGHLDEALEGSKAVDVYICGLKAMVDDVRRRLREKGFDRRRIVYEKYD